MKRAWITFFLNSARALKGSLIGLCLVPLFYIALNPDINDPNFMTGLLMSVRIGLIVVVVNLIAMSVIHALIYQLNKAELNKLSESAKFKFVLGLTGMLLGLSVASQLESKISGRHFGLQGITTGLLIGGMTYLAYTLFSEYRKTQNHNLKLRAESAESNLNVLKNQMQPHFLFNSLNSLAELIDSNRDDASLMTQKLSDLYREILDSSKSQMADLSTEISIVKKYLELESLRFGHRLQYQIQLPPNLKDIFIPSLLLQTLIENAIKHGISQSLEGGTIHLDISKASDGYSVHIYNTTHQKIKSVNSSGTGIPNTISRLNLLYGQKHNFNIATLDGMTHVKFLFDGRPNA